MAAIFNAVPVMAENSASEAVAGQDRPTPVEGARRLVEGRRNFLPRFGPAGGRIAPDQAARKSRRKLGHSR
jgi:hypothetical protein